MYIVLEGIDTTGKSTQIELLKQKYPNAVFTKEPYKLKELCLNTEDITTRTLLFMADRAKHTKEVIKPNMDKMIFSDRSFLSGIAYSKETSFSKETSLCDTLDIPLQIEMNKAISIMPDVVIILVTNSKILRERLEAKELDCIESMGVDGLLKVQSRIVNLAMQLGLNYITIPCDLDKNAIRDRIVSAVRGLG